MKLFFEVQRRELLQTLYQKYQDLPKYVIVKKLEELSIPKRMPWPCLRKGQLWKGSLVPEEDGWKCQKRSVGGWLEDQLIVSASKLVKWSPHSA